MFDCQFNTTLTIANLIIKFLIFYMTHLNRVSIKVFVVTFRASQSHLRCFTP